MGMNLAGLLLENDQIGLKDIEASLGIELQEKREDVWLECEIGIRDPNEILIVFKNDSVLLYFDIDFVVERQKELMALAISSKSGLLFGCSETSMAFVFDWFENHKHLGQDVYTFEGDFEVTGENRLNLTEEDDTIQDGLFPHIQKVIGGLEEDEACKIYSFKSLSEGPEGQSQQRQVDQSIFELQQMFKEVTTTKSDSGFDTFSRMINLARNSSNLQQYLDTRNFKNLDKTPTKDIKNQLVKLIALIEKRPISREELANYVLPVVIALTRRPTVDLEDVKNGTFKKRKWWSLK